MSIAVPLKAASKPKDQKVVRTESKSPAPAPTTFRPQELVLRPTPLRRYFE